MYRAKITVVGSINMDMVTQCRRFPDIGETLMGTDFQRYSGGKGANQAVAAARLGADVTMVGAVGDDGFGYELLTVLNREGVNTDYVKTLPDLPSGMANITVADGENQIIVVPGANSGLTPADVEAAEARIAESDVLLAQLEIPMDCVMTAAKLAAKHGKPFVLNPAPAQRLPEELLELVTLLTPNTTELACSLGLPTGMSAEDMIRRSRCPVLMTIGSDGALYNDENGQIHHQPAFRAVPIDSTGAGDTFNGAFAVYWKDGMAAAVKKACASAALSITKAGAQSGMPFEEELDAFLAQQAV